MFVHDWSEVMHFRQEYHENDTVSFSVHYIKGFMMLTCLFTSDVFLIT